MAPRFDFLVLLMVIATVLSIIALGAFQHLHDVSVQPAPYNNAKARGVRSIQSIVETNETRQIHSPKEEDGGNQRQSSWRHSRHHALRSKSRDVQNTTTEIPKATSNSLNSSASSFRTSRRTTFSHRGFKNTSQNAATATVMERIKDERDNTTTLSNTSTSARSKSKSKSKSRPKSSHRTKTKRKQPLLDHR